MPFDNEKYAGDASQYHDKSFKQRLFIIIFGTHTRLGKLFDVMLIIFIVLSVAAVMLESVNFIQKDFGHFLYVLEWIITIVFTLEYAARIWVVKDSKKYIFSFFGVIDFLSIIPTYLSIFVVGTQSLAIIRAVRILRIFRVLKLTQFVSEGGFLLHSLRQSRHKILVFFMSVLILVVIMGSIMYLIEGPENGFKSIPVSVYWAIVTLTTVGFGDITPHTVAGQFVASLIMLLGYSIIAIPTGIIGAQLYAESTKGREMNHGLICKSCGESNHLPNAKYCQHCGKSLQI